jgi:hypothetical protein
MKYKIGDTYRSMPHALTITNYKFMDSEYKKIIKQFSMNGVNSLSYLNMGNLESKKYYISP